MSTNNQQPRSQKQRNIDRMVRDAVAQQERYDGLTTKEAARRYREHQAQEMIDRFFADES